MPARAHLNPVRSIAALAAAALLAAAISACGPLPPQAPVAQASKISTALTTIVAACGESYRLQEFTAHPDLSGLDATAASSAGTLAAVAIRHPAWVYQGKTLAQISALSEGQLRSCALPRAARVLKRPAAAS